MDVDGQTEYFYRLYYKTKTDQTKQPSSPVDETTPFYFFKVLSIFNTPWQRSHSAGPSQRPAVCFEKPSSLWLAGQSRVGTSPVAETCPRAASEPRPMKQVKQTAGPGATFLVRFPQRAPALTTMKELPESGPRPMLCCGIPSAVLAPEQPTPATRHAPVLGPTQLPATTSTLPCPPRAEARR